jgi:hypothetical protein
LYVAAIFKDGDEQAYSLASIRTYIHMLRPPEFVKNETGRLRDPNILYGPLKPRTLMLSRTDTQMVSKEDLAVCQHTHWHLRVHANIVVCTQRLNSDAIVDGLNSDAIVDGLNSGRTEL